MKQTVNFGNKEIELKASAATPIRFKQFFNFDFLQTVSKIDIENIDTDSALGAGELLSKLGFVMAKQAEGANFNDLKMDDYITWLDEFEPNSIPYVDILKAYSGDKVTEIEPKKADAEQSEN